MTEKEITQRLLAYLEGELTPAEAAETERQLAQDASMRHELDAVKATLAATRLWAEESVPGAERLLELQIPRLKVQAVPRSRRSRIARLSWRLAAAAAVFVAGFALGYARNGKPFVLAPMISTEAPHLSTAATPAPAPEAQPPATAEPSAPRYTTDENGRVVVETVVPESGTRATWVVDGKFQLAQTAR